MLGIHIPSDNFDVLKNNISIIQSQRLNAIQIMNPKFNKKESKEIRKILFNSKIFMVVHTPYTINIANNWDKYSPHIFSLTEEIKKADTMGAIGVVVHLGKRKELTIEEAYNNMLTSLLFVHTETKYYKNIKIFLETTAGQGTELCSSLEDLAYFYHKIPNNIKTRIQICLDTCHLFSAGYDLRTKENIKLFLDTFEELIGLRYVGLIHLNDSSTDLGSNKDRHAIINEGYIKANALKLISNFFIKMGIIVILETPSENIGNDIKLISKNII